MRKALRVGLYLAQTKERVSPSERKERAVQDLTSGPLAKRRSVSLKDAPRLTVEQQCPKKEIRGSGYPQRTPACRARLPLSLPLCGAPVEASSRRALLGARPAAQALVPFGSALRASSLGKWRQNSEDRCQEAAPRGGRAPLSPSAASSPHGVVRKPACDGKRCNATLPPVRRPSLSWPVGVLCRRTLTSFLSDLLTSKRQWSSRANATGRRASNSQNPDWSAADDLLDATPEETPSSSAAQPPESPEMQDHTPSQPSTSQAVATRQLRPPEVRRPPDRYGDFV
ncbi:hypothetical protein HPB51_025309 [Rhipicephalus microplus]|uniref:Uncharacterized protein n=1 Tax=Rhipicephalus microplus TaxID=6941 RepID=A0A9J6FA08_RHIMP|nr:hypothetical protein HPB51_025309 [Rhipicephalus microplus]